MNMYNILGTLEVYIHEDVENEIGQLERQRTLDVVEYLLPLARHEKMELHTLIGKFRSECFVEPEKWVLSWEDVTVTIGDTLTKRFAVMINASDFFDANGYDMGCTEEDLLKEVFADGEYFLEHQNMLYIFRDGYEDADMTDLIQAEKIVKGLLFDEETMQEFEEMNDVYETED